MSTSSTLPSQTRGAVATEGGAPIQLVTLQVAAKEIGSHAKTLKRMAERDPEFPPIFPINSRDFLNRSEWEHFKRVLMARGFGKRATA